MSKKVFDQIAEGLNEALAVARGEVKIKVGDLVRVTAKWAVNGTYWCGREGKVTSIAHMSDGATIYAVCSCGEKPERRQETYLYPDEFEVLHRSRV